jgi:predicted Rossmann fold nucleotide-binding protein DprA/Smf involved in DNA uptake
VLRRNEDCWPASLNLRLRDSAPLALKVAGPPSILATSRTALFCSSKAPGDSILCAHDAARQMRDEGVTVISGFHSPIERDCLHILLRGRQPLVICPARAIESMRVPSICRAAFDAGRLLFLSPFSKKPLRVTRDSANRRNEVVAALADEAYIAYVGTGSQTERIVERLREWNVPLHFGTGTEGIQHIP